MWRRRLPSRIFCSSSSSVGSISSQPSGGGLRLRRTLGIVWTVRGRCGNEVAPFIGDAADWRRARFCLCSKGGLRVLKTSDRESGAGGIIFTNVSLTVRDNKQTHMFLAQETLSYSISARFDLTPASRPACKTKLIVSL